MKKLFLGLIATVLFSTVNYGQEKASIESCVSQKEYAAFNEQEKKVINFIDAGIAALKGMELNGSVSKKYTALINVSAKGGKLENSVIISETENLPSIHSCTICNFVSGMICIRKIINDLGNGTITITLQRDGDCYRVTWPDV